MTTNEKKKGAVVVDCRPNPRNLVTADKIRKFFAPKTSGAKKGTAETSSTLLLSPQMEATRGNNRHHFFVPRASQKIENDIEDGDYDNENDDESETEWNG